MSLGRLLSNDCTIMSDGTGTLTGPSPLLSTRGTVLFFRMSKPYFRRLAAPRIVNRRTRIPGRCPNLCSWGVRSGLYRLGHIRSYARRTRFVELASAMVQGESELAHESFRECKLATVTFRSVCRAVLLERKTDPLVLHLDHGGNTTQ